jgi:hypothetical protein
MKLFLVTSFLVGFVASALTLTQGSPAFGDDTAAPAASSGDKTSKSDSPKTPAHRSRARNRVVRGDNKETEGTTAPNRFQADTVIKSQYKLDGEQLEVDPD